MLAVQQGVGADGDVLADQRGRVAVPAQHLEHRGGQCVARVLPGRRLSRVDVDLAEDAVDHLCEQVRAAVEVAVQRRRARLQPLGQGAQGQRVGAFFVEDRQCRRDDLFAGHRGARARRPVEVAPPLFGDGGTGPSMSGLDRA